MTGLTNYSILPTKNYKDSLKELGKHYKGKAKQIFKQFVGNQLLKRLASDPYPPKSRSEPLPSNISLPDGLAFRKLEFKMQPRLGGGSGEGRLMYLVDSEQKKVVLLWIYTHEDFPKRPRPQRLRKQINEGLTLLSDEDDSLNNN